MKRDPQVFATLPGCAFTVLAALCASAGCDSAAPAGDAGLDAPDISVVDAPADAPADATADAPADARDASDVAVVDAPADVALDARVDALADAPSDRAPDALPDAAADVVDGGADAGVDPLGDFCQSYAAAQCVGQALCGHTAVTAADCATQAAQGCLTGRLHDVYFGPLSRAVRAGRLVYDVAAARDCFAALSAADPNFCRTNNPTESVPACARTFRGAVAAGGSCFGLYAYSGLNECAGGACNAVGRPMEACPGACVAYIPAGGACPTAAVGARCEPESFCVDGTCQRRAGAGASCASVACQSGLQCVSADGGMLCQAQRANGAACEGDLDCLSNVCASRVCAAHLPSGAGCSTSIACPADELCQYVPGHTVTICHAPLVAGATCVSSSVCAAGLGCVCSDVTGCPGDVTTTGTCRPTPQRRDGEPCYGGACAAGFYCPPHATGTAGTCRAASDVGGPCGSGATGMCRDGLFCIASTSTCQRPAVPGEACTADTQCLGGPCVMGRCAYGYCTEPL